MLYFIILSWFPLWWVQRSKNPKPSLAIGQFLLFPRDAYWRIGGHKAVKSRVLEDVWLGYEVHRHGGRHVVVDLSPVVSCSMYQNMKSMWAGFVRWIHSVAAISSLALIALLVAGLVFFLAPFYWLWQTFVSPASTGLQFLVACQVVVIIAMRWITDRRFREPIVSALLHPLGFSLFFAACLYGLSCQLAGVRVSWKKRLYGGRSEVA